MHLATGEATISGLKKMTGRREGEAPAEPQAFIPFQLNVAVRQEPRPLEDCSRLADMSHDTECRATLNTQITKPSRSADVLQHLSQGSLFLCSAGAVMWLLHVLRRHRWRMLAVVVAGVVCLAFPEAVSSAREAARRSQCKNNLKQISLALHNYHDTYNCFPPAITYGPDGKPWHSWRVIIMPYVECSSFYSEYSFDEPWNGPHNSQLAKKFADGAPPVYRCPSDTRSGSQNTSYVAVIGQNTIWPADGVASIRDVTNGTSNSIHIVEVSDSGVHWMEPRDLRLDVMSFQINSAKPSIRSRHRDAAHVTLVDGAVRLLGVDTPPETVRGMLDINDGKPAPIEAGTVAPQAVP